MTGIISSFSSIGNKIFQNSDVDSVTKVRVEICDLHQQRRGHTWKKFEEEMKAPTAVECGCDDISLLLKIVMWERPVFNRNWKHQ